MRLATSLFASLLLCAAATASDLRPDDLIVPQTAAARILVPAAGNAPGANGTYFRSDIQVANLRNSAQRVLMYWLPQGSSGAAIAPLAIDLSASRGFSSEDFVTNVLAQTGVGSIEFVGVTADGQFDPAAQLHVASRIWTPRPDGAAGTMSQSFPSIILPGSTSRSKTVFGVRHSPQYRINVGISNPASTVHRFRVTARIATGTIDESDVFELEVPPRSMVQRATTLTASAIGQVLIENLTTGTATDWQAWASTIDNASGDAWSQMAFPTP
jgi:hypothetical protein